MTVYYAAVSGDSLSSKDGSHVIAKPRFFTIDERDAAFIGDQAFCAACGTKGVITYGVRLSPGLRFTHEGVECAVGGDIVLCGCAKPPEIIPAQGYRWRLLDDAPATRYSYRESCTLAEQFMNLSASQWISFTLNERESCEGLSCRARFADGTTGRGFIDGNNRVRFARSNHSECQFVEIDLNDAAEQSSSVSEALLSAIFR
jgi:uncharacterized Zn-binding protein involved in type VI secretion